MASRDVRMHLIGIAVLAAVFGVCILIGAWLFLPPHRPSLFKAIDSGDVEDVKRVLASGADPNQIWSAGDKPVPTSPLYEAIVHGDVQTVSILLASGANPNLRAGDYGRTPLGTAIWHQRLDIADVLLAAGADVDGRGYSNDTSVLEYAVLRGDPKLILWMLRHGVNAQSLSADGRSALDLAVGNPDVPVDIVKILLGEDVRLSDRTRRYVQEEETVRARAIRALLGVH